MLSRMSHPNIIKAEAHGTRLSACSSDGVVPFIRLERLASSLGKELPPSAASAAMWARDREVRKWPIKRALSVGLEIARAMRYCHDEFMEGFRLLHRDLKPDNIGLASDGRAVLLDFGLCKLWARSLTASDNEVRGRIQLRTAGTLYLSLTHIHNPLRRGLALRWR